MRRRFMVDLSCGEENCGVVRALLSSRFESPRAVPGGGCRIKTGGIPRKREGAGCLCSLHEVRPLEIH